MSALLVVGVVLLVVLCDVAYLLRQVLKRLDYQSIESARHSLYLRGIRTDTLMTRRYAQHLSRRTRAPQEVNSNGRQFVSSSSIHPGAVEGKAAAR